MGSTTVRNAMARLLAGLLTVCALGWLPARLAAAPTGAVNPAQGTAGTRFNFSASGFTPGERLDAWVTPPSGPTLPRYPSVNADAAGAAVWSWDVPAGAALGAYAMTARGVTSDLRVTISFTVVAGGESLDVGSVTPTSGPPGTIFLFSAAGFNPNERVGAWLNGPDGVDRELEPPARGDLYADATGLLTWRHESSASMLGGQWRSVARGKESGRQVVVSFVVNRPADPAPQRSVTPVAGPPGTTFVVKVDGFAPEEELGSWLVEPSGKSRDAVPYMRADLAGTITWSWTSPVDAPAGNWQAVTRGRKNGVQVVLGFTLGGNNSTPLPPQSTVSGSVTPPSGPAMTAFTFDASGFAIEEELGYWPTRPDGNPERTTLKSKANNEGKVQVTWIVPDSALVGEWVMHFEGKSSGRTLTIPFTVTAAPMGPAITVNPSKGAPGTVFEVKGQGFNHAEVISIWLEGPDANQQNISGSFKSDDFGVFTWQWYSPTDIVGGLWTVVFKGKDTRLMLRATVTIERDAPPTQASAQVSPARGPRGTSFTFTASGYKEDERVGYWFNAPDGTIIPSGVEVRADSAGVVTIVWTAPSDAAFGHWTLAMRSSQDDKVRNDVAYVVPFEVVP